MASIDKNKIGTAAARKASGQKITQGINAVTVTQTEMGRAIGVTRQRVGQLIQDGTFKTDANGSLLLVENLRRFYQETADEEADFNKEKALHEKAKREIAELQLQKMKKQAYSARVVEYVMTEMLSNLRTQLLGLPSKLAPMIEGKSKDDIYTTMTTEIEEKLSELSDYSPDLFDEEIEEGDDEDS